MPIPTGRSEIIAKMVMELTAVYMKVQEGYIAFIEDLSGSDTMNGCCQWLQKPTGRSVANLRMKLLVAFITSRAISSFNSGSVGTILSST